MAASDPTHDDAPAVAAGNPPLAIPKRQHTVSQVVLRQFTSNGELTIHDAERQIFTTKGPGAGFHMLFDSHDPIGSEKLWRATEEAIPAMYAALAAGTANSPDVEAVIRDVLALHWARSTAIKQTYARIANEVKLRSIERFAVQRDLVALGYLQQTGQPASTQEDLDHYIIDVHERIMTEHQDEWMSEGHPRRLAEARRLMDRHFVQVAYAPQGFDFMISDAPVVTMKDPSSGLGPHQAVALGDATEVFMPISPNVMVGLGPHAGTGTVTPLDVLVYNSLQERARIRWLGCRPKGWADSVLRAGLPDRNRRGSLRNGLRPEQRRSAASP